MKLIADSGSTKTDWVLTESGNVKVRCQTQGINPLHQSAETIVGVLRNELLPQLSIDVVELEIDFYGSGVRPELESQMNMLLKQVFPTAAVESHSDLLGAARALCGSSEGIACILGTGANSCLYDGHRIVQNTPPLGYILGDEGSGAVLGRKFLNALYKGVLPISLIVRVYRQPLANRFLASLSPFISRYADVPEVHQLIVDNFRDFFSRNVVPYGRPDLPVGFVGSIAGYYQEQLREAAAAEGFTVGRILSSPIEGLVDYHQPQQ